MTRTLIMLLALTLKVEAQVPRILLPEVSPADNPLSDIQALVDRIAQNGRKVSDRLAEGKIQPSTLRDQKQVKEDMDQLIELLDQSPQSSPSSSSPSGSTSSSKPDSNDSRRESQKAAGNSSTLKQKSAGGIPMSGTPSVAGGAPGQSGTAARQLSLPPEESLARDFWGHLPDVPRQQMLQFYREQHMGKYKELLSRYYQSLAEKERKK